MSDFDVPKCSYMKDDSLRSSACNENMAVPNNQRVLWVTAKVDELIVHFKAHPCLYNRKIREYNDKTLRLEALRSIAGEMQISCDDVYRKIVNLRSQFRREKHREVKFASEGNAENAASQIKWIHYRQLKFLDEFVTLRNPRTDCMQYSPTNGFGDFEESLEEDVEYDGIDVEEYKVGLGEDENDRTIDLTAGESPHNELHALNNDSYDFHRQSPMQERGLKRLRPDLNVSHQELHVPDRGQYHDIPNSNTSAIDRQPLPVPPVENTHSLDREGLDPSQSAQLQRASSHIQKAMSCFENIVGNTRHCKRCDNDDDDDMIFARYIASELRQIPNGATKRLVKHQIQNLVYGAHCKPHALQS